EALAPEFEGKIVRVFWNAKLAQRNHLFYRRVGIVEHTDHPPLGEPGLDGKHKDFWTIIFEQVRRTRRDAMGWIHLSQNLQPFGFKVDEAVPRNHGAPGQGDDCGDGSRLWNCEQCQSEMVCIINPGFSVEVVTLRDSRCVAVVISGVLLPGQ